MIHILIAFYGNGDRIGFAMVRCEDEEHMPSLSRFPQLRASKRIPGKYRWVLYEMWPLTCPITQQPCVLVCEQNITQVKSLEEQFRKQNQRLEAQLEEALAQRDMVHKSAIDIDTPADKTLKMLDKFMKGYEVHDLGWAVAQDMGWDALWREVSKLYISSGLRSPLLTPSLPLLLPR